MSSVTPFNAVLKVNMLTFSPDLRLSDFSAPKTEITPMAMTRKGRSFHAILVVANNMIDLQLQIEDTTPVDGNLVVVTHRHTIKLVASVGTIPEYLYIAAFPGYPGIGMLILPTTRFTPEEVEIIFPRIIRLAQEGFHGDIDTHVDNLCNALDLFHIVIASSHLPDDTMYEFYGSANLLSRADDRYYAQKSMSL